MKPRILWYGDSPTSPTGFGHVTSSLIDHLHDTFDFLVVGINETGQPHSYPCHVIPSFGPRSDGDVFGRRMFLRTLNQHAAGIDLVFLLQDHFLLSEPIDGKPFIEHVAQLCERRGIALVVYFPVDGQPAAHWIAPLQRADVVATYTEWGAAACAAVCPSIKDALQVIPHGADPDMVEYSADQRRAMREEYHAIDKDRFLVGFVGQNQQRKLLDWLALYAGAMAKLEPNFTLLLKTPAEAAGGWRVGNLLHNLGIPPSVVQVADATVPRHEMVDYYNLFDAFILPGAEGWGLPATEAMSCGVPTILGDHAALSYLGAGGRSLLINCPDDPNFVQVAPRDLEVPRRRPDIHHAVALTRELMADYDATRERLAQACRPWLASITWSEVAREWGEIFAELIAARRATLPMLSDSGPAPLDASTSWIEPYKEGTIGA